MGALLDDLRAEAERAGLRVSWSRPESWHATLKFLGEIDEAKAATAGNAIRPLASEQAPFPVAATGLMTLPRRASKPKVIAVTLADDGRLAALASAVDQRIEAHGFAPEQRAYTPHLTLGRIRDPRGWRRFAPAVARHAAQDIGTSEVHEMALYRSRLGDGPARYEIIERFAFGGGR